MNSSLKHIALIVPDLQEAERYYSTLFDMKLLGREAKLPDGLWYTLPFDKGWENAKAAGIELDMLALQKDHFVLALFRGTEITGQVRFIGLQLSAGEIFRIRARLPKGTQVDDDSPDSLEFKDPYQITWQITTPGVDFQTTGDWANRWLNL